MNSSLRWWNPFCVCLGCSSTATIIVMLNLVWELKRQNTGLVVSMRNEATWQLGVVWVITPLRKLVRWVLHPCCLAVFLSGPRPDERFQAHENEVRNEIQCLFIYKGNSLLRSIEKNCYAYRNVPMWRDFIHTGDSVSLCQFILLY